MATIKTYTDIEQSKKLAEFLPLESADMYYFLDPTPAGNIYHLTVKRVDVGIKNLPQYGEGDIPCWSLASLFNLIKDKCGYFEFVYFKGRANPLEDVYRLSTDVYDVYNKEAVDACIEMIEKLYKE